MNTALIDALKSALRVWVFTTLGLFLPGMLGWINEVTKWAAEKGAPAFPDPSNLMYLFIAAVTAGFPAAVAGIWRFIENMSGHTVLPRASQVPTHTPGVKNDAGEGYLGLVVAVLVILILLVVLTRLL